MFPKDTQTEVREISGIGTFDFDSGSTQKKTVLGVSIQQSGNQSETAILCGSEQIAKNYATNFSFSFLNYKCENVLQMNKTGAGDSAFVIINYVRYDTISGTTSPTYINGFSYDGIFIGLLLFLMFSLMFFGGIWNKVIGIKTKIRNGNKFLGNNSEEGKIIYYD